MTKTSLVLTGLLLFFVQTGTNRSLCNIDCSVVLMPKELERNFTILTNIPVREDFDDFASPYIWHKRRHTEFILQSDLLRSSV